MYWSNNILVKVQGINTRPGTYKITACRRMTATTVGQHFPYNSRHDRHWITKNGNRNKKKVARLQKKSKKPATFSIHPSNARMHCLHRPPAPAPESQVDILWIRQISYRPAPTIITGGRLPSFPLPINIHLFVCVRPPIGPTKNSSTPHTLITHTRIFALLSLPCLLKSAKLCQHASVYQPPSLLFSLRYPQCKQRKPPGCSSLTALGPWCSYHGLPLVNRPSTTTAVNTQRHQNIVLFFQNSIDAPLIDRTLKIENTKTPSDP